MDTIDHTAEVQRPSPFPGVLWPGEAGLESRQDPACFHDLHLDDIVNSVTAGREQYDLAPFFRALAPDVDTVQYRHEVFRDLEEPASHAVVRAFAAGMTEVRERLRRRSKAHYLYEQERWFVAAASAYCEAVTALLSGLRHASPKSRALAGLMDYVATYVESAIFTALQAEARGVEEELGRVRYRLRFGQGRVAVMAIDDEPDFGAEIIATFDRFKQGAGREYRFALPESPELNHVEAAVLERVALVFPGPFAALHAFAQGHPDFADPVMLRFDRETQFYLGYLEFMGRMRQGGLGFTLPEVSRDAQALVGTAIFDAALAVRLVRDKGRVVTNDVAADGRERIIVVTGPNQGGKTTYARMIGQLHHLAAIGLPVPGTSVRLGLVDGIHTLFEREEVVEDLASKLEDDLRRMRGILDQVTSRSLVVMNETFSSTTVGDQSSINRLVLAELAARGTWCVTVTFLDELASLGPTTVSMVSNVDPAQPARRTFRITRRPADGLAYAHAIAEKHGLAYEQVRSRIAR